MFLVDVKKNNYIFKQYDNKCDCSIFKFSLKL